MKAFNYRGTKFAFNSDANYIFARVLVELHESNRNQPQKPITELIQNINALIHAIDKRDDAQIKRVCRQLFSFFHPDKLYQLELLPATYEALYNYSDTIKKIISPMIKSNIDTNNNAALNKGAGKPETAPLIVANMMSLVVESIKANENNVREELLGFLRFFIINLDAADTPPPAPTAQADQKAKQEQAQRQQEAKRQEEEEAFKNLKQAQEYLKAVEKFYGSDSSLAAEKALNEAQRYVNRVTKVYEEARKAHEQAKESHPTPADQKAKRQQEDAKRKQEEDAKRKQEEDAKRKQEEDAKRKQEEAKRKQEEEAKRKQEEEAKRKQEEDKPEEVLPQEIARLKKEVERLKKEVERHRKAAGQNPNMFRQMTAKQTQAGNQPYERTLADNVRIKLELESNFRKKYSLTIYRGTDCTQDLFHIETALKGLRESGYIFFDEEDNIKTRNGRNTIVTFQCEDGKTADKIMTEVANVINEYIKNNNTSSKPRPTIPGF